MFDDLLRALKDRMFFPAAVVVGRWVSPNALSLLAFGAGVAAALAAAHRLYGVALACWLASRGLDGLDGSVARATGRQSDFGGYFDMVLDFAVYAAVPLGLVYGARDGNVALAGIALLGSFLVNAASWMYLAAILERRGRGADATGERTTITMPPGVVAGAETIVFYTLFLVLPGRLTLLFSLMTAGVLLNVVQRLAWARRQI